MTFTTLTYILFLWTVFAIYWALRSRSAQNLLLVVVSYIFYGWWDYRFCALMMISTLVDFVAGAALGRTQRQGWRRVLLAASIATNLGTLCVFKYYNFFAESFQAMLAAIKIGKPEDAQRVYEDYCRIENPTTAMKILLSLANADA